MLRCTPRESLRVCNCMPSRNKPCSLVVAMPCKLQMACALVVHIMIKYLNMAARDAKSLHRTGGRPDLVFPCSAELMAIISCTLCKGLHHADLIRACVFEVSNPRL